METTREHNRKIVSKRVDFRVTVAGKKTVAIIMDYSDGGAKIANYGDSFSVGTLMHINSVRLDLHKKSRVVWNRDIGNSILHTLKVNDQRLEGFKLFL